MPNKKFLGLALAATIGLSALAGCTATAVGQVTPQSGMQPGATAPGSINQTAAGTQAQVGANAQAQVARPAAAEPAVAVGQVPAAAAQASVEAGQETAAALAEEREMDDYDALADEEGAGRYVLYQLDGVKAGVTLRGELKAEQKAAIERLTKKRDELRSKAAKLEIKADVKVRVAARRAKYGEKVRARLDKMKDAREKIRGAVSKAPWVDNGDGTKTRTLAFSVTKTLNGKTFERSATIVRTRNADGVLILATAEFSQALPGGLTRTSTRSKTLNADGTYSIEFGSVITLPKGGTRTADWSKTIAADGAVTGTGTIVWKNAAGEVKKTVTIALGGTEEEPQAECEDPATNAEADVTVTADGAIEATIGDDEGGKAVEVTIDTSADGSVEVVTDEPQVSVDAAGDVVVADAAATATATEASTTK